MGCGLKGQQLLQSEGLLQCPIYLGHGWKDSNGPVYFDESHRGQVVRHDYGVHQDAGRLALGRFLDYPDTTGMPTTGKVARNHGYDDLLQAGTQIVCLDDEGRTPFCSNEVGIGE